MTPFTLFLVSQLVCNAASKLYYWIRSKKKATCYQLSTKTGAKQLINLSNFRLKEAATGGVL